MIDGEGGLYCVFLTPQTARNEQQLKLRGGEVRVPEEPSHLVLSRLPSSRGYSRDLVLVLLRVYARNQTFHPSYVMPGSPSSQNTRSTSKRVVPITSNLLGGDHQIVKSQEYERRRPTLARHYGIVGPGALAGTGDIIVCGHDRRLPETRDTLIILPRVFGWIV